jgi:hypothetical protein
MFLNSVLNVWDIFQRSSGVDVCNETVLILRFIGVSDLIGAMLVEGHESRNAPSRSHESVLGTDVVIIRKRGVRTRFEREDAFSNNVSVMDSEQTLLLVKLAKRNVATEPMYAREMPRCRCRGIVHGGES